MPGQDQGAGLQLLQRVRQQLDSVTGFEAEIMSRTQGHYKQGEKVAELRKVSVGYKIVWAKPSKFKAEVYNAPTPLMEGAGLVTTDGKNITARAKGLLGFLPIKLTAKEPKLGNARNHTFDRYCPNAQIQRLTGPQAVWTVVGQGQTPAGAPVTYVAIDGVPRLDNEITREIMGVEVNNAALRSLTGYAGQEKVTDYQFDKFRWNPKITSETFAM